MPIVSPASVRMRVSRIAGEDVVTPSEWLVASYQQGSANLAVEVRLKQDRELKLAVEHIGESVGGPSRCGALHQRKRMHM
jgi:hypothetical protein